MTGSCGSPLAGAETTIRLRSPFLVCAFSLDLLLSPQHCSCDGAGEPKKDMSEGQQETLSKVTGDLEIQLWDHRFFWLRIGFEVSAQGR